MMFGTLEVSLVPETPLLAVVSGSNLLHDCTKTYAARKLKQTLSLRQGQRIKPAFPYLSNSSMMKHEGQSCNCRLFVRASCQSWMILYPSSNLWSHPHPRNQAENKITKHDIRPLQEIDAMKLNLISKYRLTVLLPVLSRAFMVATPTIEKLSRPTSTVINVVTKTVQPSNFSIA